MKMRFWMLMWGCLCVGAWAQQTHSAPSSPTSPSAILASVVSVQSRHIDHTGARPVELVCPRKGPAQTRPSSPAPEPTEIPDDDEVEQALQEARAQAQGQTQAQAKGSTGGLEGFGSAKQLLRSGALRQGLPGHLSGHLPGQLPGHLRMAIWGDSHMAAAFFSDHLLRQMLRQEAAADATVGSRFVHAGVGHGGVRALVRKTCLSGDWGREMAYAHADAAAAPGPGMTSLVAKRPGATLAMDLRDAQGQARHTRLQILHHGDGANAVRLAISLNGEAETQVTLAAQAGPNALALTTNAPLSTLQIRVVEGAFRFQGLKLTEPATPTPTPTPPTSLTPAIHLDLFAYPGATVAGWVRSDLAYLASWFTDQPYDLALIAFGTNEGNDPRFSEAAYRDTLNQALRNFRQVFPQTQCVLIGPGDRGMRVAKPKAAKGSKKQATQKPSGQASASKNSKVASAKDKKAKSKASAPPRPPNTAAAPVAQLLKYSRIHTLIGQIQAEAAAQNGCLAWSMQDAMGGAGSAYQWARKNPPLMAPDLIHFTPAGYRELADRFMADFGLSKP